jgi:hypothetical protein
MIKFDFDHTVVFPTLPAAASKPRPQHHRSPAPSTKSVLLLITVSEINAVLLIPDWD